MMTLIENIMQLLLYNRAMFLRLYPLQHHRRMGLWNHQPEHLTSRMTLAVSALRLETFVDTTIVVVAYHVISVFV
jgi:hypothetical protein